MSLEAIFMIRKEPKSKKSEKEGKVEKVVKEKQPERKKEPVKKDETLAVVELSGRQHLVKRGDVLTIDHQNLEVGQKFAADKVLLSEKSGDVKIGQPYLADTKISLEVLKNFKGKKIEIIKYKAKSRYRKHIGYRSHLTKVRVVEILRGD